MNRSLTASSMLVDEFGIQGWCWLDFWKVCFKFGVILIQFDSPTFLASRPSKLDKWIYYGSENLFFVDEFIFCLAGAWQRDWADGSASYIFIYISFAKSNTGNYLRALHRIKGISLCFITCIHARFECITHTMSAKLKTCPLSNLKFYVHDWIIWYTQWE